MICLQKIKHLEWWRLCFFLATLAPICWATSLAVKLLVMAVESQLFIAKNVLYFMAAIKVMPFYCAVMQVSAILCFDNYVSQHSVYTVLFSNILWEVHSFEVVFAPCC